MKNIAIICMLFILTIIMISSSLFKTTNIEVKADDYICTSTGGAGCIGGCDLISPGPQCGGGSTGSSDGGSHTSYSDCDAKDQQQCHPFNLGPYKDLIPPHNVLYPGNDVGTNPDGGTPNPAPNPAPCSPAGPTTCGPCVNAPGHAKPCPDVR